MATKTSLLGLTKPAYTEAADIAVLNTNFDLIDKAVGNGARGANLLVNSNFANPVNWQGLTEYKGNYARTIDGWMLSASTMILSADGMTLQGSETTAAVAGQYIQRLKNGVYTFAAKVDGAIKTRKIQISGTTVTTLDNSNAGFTGGYISATYSSKGLYSFDIRANATFSVTIEWAALYEGAYTAETLPAYIVPDKRIEMIRCGVPLNPPNLLDNSYFRAGSAIAQAGVNGTHRSTKYPLDRWISWDKDITQSNNYITIGSPIDQYVESYKIDPSAVYTAAVGFADGSMQVVSGNFTTGFGSKATGCLYCGTASSGKPFVRMQTGFNICWVALYEGAYDADTIPEYHYKGYAAELAECQRYFRKVINAQGYVSAVSAYMFLPYTMRALPSVTIKAVGSVRTQGSQVTPTGNYDIKMYADSIRIELAGTYPGKDHAAVLFNADIDLSADL